jgi:hypothetical protein
MHGKDKSPVFRPLIYQVYRIWSGDSSKAEIFTCTKK